MTRQAFTAELDARIRDRLGLSRDDLFEVGYEEHPVACRRALTLFNVETVRCRKQSRDRYSFAAHASNSWSLEHIHAQSAEPLTRADQWTEWLRLHQAALGGLPHIDTGTREELIAEIEAALPDVTGHQFRELEAKVVQHFQNAEAEGGDETHRLSNLALLSGEDNSALKNSCFEVKRRHILELDRDGRDIPPCTRNAFLKYYTKAGAQQVHFWGPQDRRAYMDAIVDTLEPYLKAPAPGPADEPADGGDQ